MKFGQNDVSIGKQKCFVLTWFDGETGVSYRLKETTQDMYERLTSMFGSPTCKYEDYLFMIW
jgi:hypothetical protein